MTVHGATHPSREETYRRGSHDAHLQDNDACCGIVVSQVDFEVWKRAHNFFDFETLTPIKAKGYVDPVPVFRPLGQALKDDNTRVRRRIQVAERDVHPASQYITIYHSLGMQVRETDCTASRQ